MDLFPFIVNALALIFAKFAFSVYFYLNYHVFIAKKFKMNSELSLIYCRFAVDFCYIFAACIYLFFFLIKKASPDLFIFDAFQNLLFFTTWPSYTLGSIRAILVLLISVDRLFATCLPFLYRKYRPKIHNSMVIILIVVYAIVLESIVLFGVCGFELPIPMECASVFCVLGKCYASYWLNYEQVIYLITGVLSLILFIRLFLFKNPENQRLTRANRIALLDTIIALVFDLLPAFIIINTAAILGASLGPFSTMCKQFGYLIEGCIICRIMLKSYLKQSSSVIPIIGSGSSKF